MTYIREGLGGGAGFGSGVALAAAKKAMNNKVANIAAEQAFNAEPDPAKKQAAATAAKASALAAGHSSPMGVPTEAKVIQAIQKVVPTYVPPVKPLPVPELLPTSDPGVAGGGTTNTTMYLLIAAAAIGIIILKSKKR
jgi:hypothetical protein